MTAVPVVTSQSSNDHIRSIVDARLMSYTKLMYVEIDALGTDAEGLATARPTTPADNPSIQRPFYPLIGSAAVGDWKMALSTAHGMVILGEATGGGSGGPATNGLPAGGTAGHALQKIDGTNYNAKWVPTYYPENHFDGADPLTSYEFGYTVLDVDSTSTGWPVASTEYTILTARAGEGEGFQVASLNTGQKIYHRRWNLGGLTWGTWREMPTLDPDSILNTGGFGVIERASMPVVTANQGLIATMDRMGKTEWYVKDSTAELNVLMQDSWFMAENKSGVALSRGMITKLDTSAPTIADTPTITRCNANSSASTGLPAIGFVMDATVAIGANCRVMTKGILTGVSTTGFAIGDPLYVGTTVGTITNVEPASPHRSQKIGTVLSVGASGAILVNVSPEVKVGAGVPRLNILTTAADVINNNAVANTLQTVTGLSFAVTAGLCYKFKAILLFTSAATTTGWRFTVNGPASMTHLYYRTTTTPITGNTATTAAVPVVSEFSTLNLPAAATASTQTANTNNMCTIEGIFIPSANGTFEIRFASEVANSAVTVKQGSSLEWYV